MSKVTLTNYGISKVLSSCSSLSNFFSNYFKGTTLAVPTENLLKIPKDIFINDKYVIYLYGTSFFIKNNCLYVHDKEITYEKLFFILKSCFYIHSIDILNINSLKGCLYQYCHDDQLKNIDIKVDGNSVLNFYLITKNSKSLRVLKCYTAFRHLKQSKCAFPNLEKCISYGEEFDVLDEVKTTYFPKLVTLCSNHIPLSFEDIRVKNLKKFRVIIYFGCYLKYQCTKMPKDIRKMICQYLMDTYESRENNIAGERCFKRQKK
jgi:hypothetical protein